MGYKYRSPYQDGVSAPGSRNTWWMETCKEHGDTPHQTPFGCEMCQRARLVKEG